MTPEQANAEIIRLKDDKEWLASYLTGDKSKVARMDQLQGWANAGRR